MNFKANFRQHLNFIFLIISAIKMLLDKHNQLLSAPLNLNLMINFKIQMLVGSFILFLNSNSEKNPTLVRHLVGRYAYVVGILNSSD